jgi:2-amino-4-hydroxy-6-hydroxymethyldihydropteridine diphosphokinase
MILIAFGANLPGPDGSPPEETCRRALAAIGKMSELSIAAVSPLYISEPVPISDQPSYITGVLRAGGDIDPAVLLARLLEIESRFGRRRSGLNAARSLDLDIIAMGAMGSLVRAAPDPVLPHPRAHERAFVLCPLADVASEWLHPVIGQTASEILAALPPQALARFS